MMANDTTTSQWEINMDEQVQRTTTRRKFIGATGAAIAGAAATTALAQQATQQNATPIRSPQHNLPNEIQVGPTNPALDAENPSSVWTLDTDNGTVPPFKYSFSLAHKRIESGGWTRQVTQRELAISKTMAGVEMRLVAGGVRELHWHVGSEWAYMIYGNARITAVDAEGRSCVNDVGPGDLWLFPEGIPHSIQGLGPDGAKFLLVFNQGDFDEFSTFLLTDWFAHTPKDVLAKNFATPASTFAEVPKKELFIFATDAPRSLAEEQKAAAAGTGEINDKYVFKASAMKPTKERAGGEVRVIDRKNFPVTGIAAAIVRLKPGGLRELHWHPLADEWQYYVSGKGRMTVFEAGSKARTFDFTAGDVGYIQQSRPHYIENTGTEDFVFLEVFPNDTYQDISAAEWLAHTPSRLVNQHLKTGEDFLAKLPKQEEIITPL
jgi:oxalate decarboxylase